MLDELDKTDGKHTRDYTWLTEKFPKADVNSDAEFQRRFRNYWRLNYARLSDEFLRSYFSLPQTLKLKGANEKGNKELVGEVARKLYDTPVNRKGQRKIEFSFASKLVHTLRPHAPIYDRNIKLFFLFRNPTGPKKFDMLLEAYEFLTREYERILSMGILASSIEQFRKRFDSHAFLDEKIIDSLIWSFVVIPNSQR